MAPRQSNGKLTNWKQSSRSVIDICRIITTTFFRESGAYRKTYSFYVALLIFQTSIVQRCAHKYKEFFVWNCQSLLSGLNRNCKVSKSAGKTRSIRCNKSPFGTSGLSQSDCRADNYKPAGHGNNHCPAGHVKNHRLAWHGNNHRPSGYCNNHCPAEHVKTTDLLDTATITGLLNTATITPAGHGKNQEYNFVTFGYEHVNVKKWSTNCYITEIFTLQDLSFSQRSY